MLAVIHVSDFMFRQIWSCFFWFCFVFSSFGVGMCLSFRKHKLITGNISSNAIIDKNKKMKMETCILLKIMHECFFLKSM